MVSTVVMSSVTVSLMCCILEGSVSVFAWCWCNDLLLVLNAGPSKFVAVSNFMVALPSVGNLTNLERQLVALFHAPDIHLNINIIGCKFQPPSVDLVIGILSI